MMKKRLLDKLHLLMYGLSVVGWSTLFYSLLVFDEGRPEMNTILTSYFDIEIRKSWLENMYLKLQKLLWFCAVVTSINFMLNSYLKISNKERMSLGIILLLIISSAGLLVLKIWEPQIML